MTDREDIPAALADRIDEMSERGNVLLEDRGDWQGAIRVWRDALALLPAPNAQGDEAAWLHASIGTARLQGGDRDGAFASFDQAYRCGDGHLNPFVLLNLGSLMRSRDEGAAVKILLSAYMLEGEALFAEGNREDLDFLAARVEL